MTVVKTSMRNFVAHKGRMALSAIAVLLSVGFVCGTLVFTDTMTSTFDKLFAVTAADVTVSAKDAPGGNEQQQTAKAASVPASVLTGLRKTDGVKSALGDVSNMALTVVTGKGNDNLSPSSGAPTIGTNWDSSELKVVDLTSGHAPRGPTEVMVDKDTADKHHLKLGDELRVIAAPGEFRAKITGITTFKVTNPGAAVFYFDTPTAQTRLLGSADAYSNIMLTADQGVSDEQLKKTVAADLGTGYKVQTQAEFTAENKQGIDSFLGVIKTAMLGFAGIALLVGIFLIVNTFSMLVAQRTREIGLMRAIGASRSQVNRSVLVEATVLGVVGSILGIGGGVGIAVLLMKLMSKLGMNLDTSELTIKTATPLIGLAVGVIVTVLAAYLPARRGGKVSPMAALRDSRHPGGRQGGPDPGRDRTAPHRCGRRGAVRHRAGHQGQHRRADTGRRSGPHPRRIRRRRPAPGRCRRPGHQRGRPADLRPRRAARRAQRAAQPPPYGCHGRRPHDRPRPGRGPVGGRVVHGGLHAATSSTSRSARTSSSSRPPACPSPPRSRRRSRRRPTSPT